MAQDLVQGLGLGLYYNSLGLIRALQALALEQVFEQGIVL